MLRLASLYTYYANPSYMLLAKLGIKNQAIFQVFLNCVYKISPCILWGSMRITMTTLTSIETRACVYF